MSSLAEPHGSEPGANDPTSSEVVKPAPPKSLLQQQSTGKSRQDSASKDASTSSPPNGLDQPQAAIDPLSSHILKRTQTQIQVPQKPRPGPSEAGNDLGALSSSAGLDPSASQNRRSVDPVRGETFPGSKEKKKGASFLSRLMNNKKKEVTVSTDDDDESEYGERRIEGMDAHVFSQPLGFIPKFPEPPKYIKVRSHNKKDRDFNRLFLAQELFWDQIDGKSVNGGTATPPVNSNGSKVEGSPIWALEFSKDGKYLAAAGKDKIVRVWEVLSSADQREAFDKDEENRPYLEEEKGQRLEAPVFHHRPTRTYDGHTQDVLDLSWSKNNFLLSSSMDKTVRLWHISRNECLCAFKHSDFVTSISFHPKDDRFFLAGSLDSKLRLWSIPDKSVAFFTILQDLITSVAFTPDGKTAIAGCLTGVCFFYETEGLKYTTQIHVRSSHGRNAKGSKITGIRSLTIPPDNPNGEVKLLVTSNDSRIRLYNLRDKALEMKFKGNVNSANQIHARISEDAKYVICGSEDRKAFIWSTGPGEDDKKDKRPVEFFEAHKAIVTAAVIAPTATKQLLSFSGDPVFDLCNPPKVTLISRNDSKASSRPPTVSDTSSIPPETPIKEEVTQSEGWTARSVHADGNIIVTSDYTGQIKIFRQDCAFLKRRNDSWETGSTFSKRVNSSKFGGRASTFGTRNTSQSRRDSGSFIHHQPSDRILSWRNSIGSSNASLDSSSLRNGVSSLRSSTTKPPSWRNRSTSPRKASLTQLSSQHRSSDTPTSSRFPLANTGTPSVSTNSPPASIYRKGSEAATTNGGGDKAATGQQPTLSTPKVFVSPEDPMMIQPTGQSFAFYNTANWKTTSSTSAGNEEYDASHLAPLEKGVSRLSTLSSEEDSSMGEEDDDGGEGGAAAGKGGAGGVICKKCGGGKFKATGIRGIGRGRRNVCERCGIDAPS